jgi:general secretion pathway protein D
MRNRRIEATLLVLLCLAWSGCAAHSAYRQGLKEAKKGNWDVAVARLTKALAADPLSIEYKIALENARVQASRQHYTLARKHMAADELEEAVKELDIATKYDPSNKSASDDLIQVQEDLRKREADKRRLSEFDTLKARVEATRASAPVLSPRSPVPIILKFSDSSLEKIFDTLSKVSGVNILLDPDFRDRRVNVDLKNVTFQQAIDELTLMSHLFYKVIDSNTLIVAPESPQKRRTYDDELLRTFYLQNADVTETLNLLKGISASPTFRAVGNPSLGSITVRGTVDEIAVAAKVIEDNDKAKGEVLVEVEILEVSRGKLRNYGIALSNYEVRETFNPTGTPLDSSGFTTFQAQVLSSLNLSDFVTSIPSTLFARFMQNESDVRLLASPRLRAAEGEKSVFKVVSQVPVPTTTFQTTNVGGATFSPVTSTVYKDVGVNMELTPKVNPNGDIVLKMSAEFSSLGQPVTVNGTAFPTFLSRTLTGVLRGRDGQTSLIGGLVQGREATSLAGIIGLQDVPILNKIFTATNKTKDDTEILISLTPHLVRAPKLTEGDLKSLAIGTGEVTRVSSAHPPLFGGPEDQAPEPSPQPPPSATSNPPPASDTSAPEAPPSPVAASFKPAGVALKVGEPSSVSLALDGKDLLGLNAELSYDPTSLEVVDVAAGALFTSDGAILRFDRSMENGRVRVQASRPTTTQGVGEVLTLQLRGLKPGTSNLAVRDLIIITRAGSQRATLPGPCIVTVSP